MIREFEDLTARVDRLERINARQRTVMTTVFAAFAVIVLIVAARPITSADVVRTRLLIIEDSTGKDRIRMGAPMPDPRLHVGMQILSPDGQEQFGLALKANGAVGMGFDVKPGVGDPRNRERLNMGVTATGQGWIRYLDNGTRARMFLRLDDKDNPSLEFLSWPDDHRIQIRAIGFEGEKRSERARSGSSGR